MKKRIHLRQRSIQLDKICKIGKFVNTFFILFDFQATVTMFGFHVGTIVAQISLTLGDEGMFMKFVDCSICPG